LKNKLENSSIKKSVLLGIIFTILIFIIHGFFSFFINDLGIIRLLRPIRDILFFPFILIVDHTFEIFCWIAKIGPLDYGRCIVPTGPGLNMPEGAPSWFEWSVFISSFIILIFYYISIFKIIIEIKKRLFKTKVQSL
jgi:hypothetical protein